MECKEKAIWDSPAPFPASERKHDEKERKYAEREKNDMEAQPCSTQTQFQAAKRLVRAGAARISYRQVVVMTQPEEVTAALLCAIADIYEDDSVSEKLKELRLSGVREVYPYIQNLHEGYIRTDVIVTIVTAKLDFLRKAKSKAEVRKILSPPKVHYNGQEVVPTETKYHIPAEEMLIWSETSFPAPLNEAGRQRYFKLFRDYFGDELADSIGLPQRSKKKAA